MASYFPRCRMKLSKVIRVFVPLFLPVLLSGCGSAREEARLEEFSARLAEAENTCFTAAMRCEYPDRVEDLTLHFEGGEEECTVTVERPENIAGIRARITEKGGALEYDGLILDVGDISGITPMSALPLIYGTLRTPFIDHVWSEGENTVYSLIQNDETWVNVWFTADMIPCRAEIVSGGTVAVHCEILDWS